MANLGCRVFTVVNRSQRELVEAFADIPVANIADEMNRFFCVNAKIKPYNNNALLGCAFTVKTRPGDNLMLHKALEMAQAGDVIVVDAQGDLNNAITGEIMMLQATVNGLAGVVIDGAIRDAEAISELSMPVYAAGVQPKGPYKDGPGEINVPICCGGVVVNPGDIMVGDSDGLVVIPQEFAAEVLEKAKNKMANEQKALAAIRNKVPRDKTWIGKTLEKLNCEIVEGSCK